MPPKLRAERIAAEAAGGAGFIPSAAEQRRNMRLVRKLYAAEDKNLCGMTGLPEKVLELPRKFEAFDPKGAIENLFDGWYSETNRLLFTSLWILAGVLILIFRKECLDFIAPVFVAYTAVSGLLMFMGEALNFFARICFFIFIGLGLDYSIFRWHARRHPHQPTERAVWYAFLTSLVGFGLLGFTEFAVTRLMGITLAAGLAAAKGMGVSLDPTMAIALTASASAPVAAMDTMFASKYGRDVDVSVGLVAVTTILSILTMPILVGVAMWIFRAP